jgi:uncharacterized protein
MAMLMAACSAESSESPARGGGDGAPSLPVIRFVTATGKTVPLAVEVADEGNEQTCGLMHRESLPDEQGMIFVYQADATGGFWMRNTLIPLSIAYVAADGRIVDILEMDPVPAPKHTPHMLPDGRRVAIADGAPIPPGATIVTYPPRGRYRYAIEANKGWFARHGIAAGDRVDLGDATRAGDRAAPPPICQERGA